MKKTLILEKSLDFRQFQNLIILIFVTSMTFLGLTYSEEFQVPILIKLVLGILTILFIAILLTKKGLMIEDKKLHTGIFLFGFTLKKKLVDTSHYQKLGLYTGKLSTNYAYTNQITILNKWEPNLNHSEFSYTLVMENEDRKQKIIMLTKPEKAKLAIEFVIENTTLIN